MAGRPTRDRKNRDQLGQGTQFIEESSTQNQSPGTYTINSNLQLYDCSSGRGLGACLFFLVAPPPAAAQLAIIDEDRVRGGEALKNGPLRARSRLIQPSSLMYAAD